MNNKGGDDRVYKDIKYHEKRLKFEKTSGDRTGEGRAYGNLGNAYWVTSEKPLSIMKNI